MIIHGTICVAPGFRYKNINLLIFLLTKFLVEIKEHSANVSGYFLNKAT